MAPESANRRVARSVGRNAKTNMPISNVPAPVITLALQMRFASRDGGRPVGAGVVTTVSE